MILLLLLSWPTLFSDSNILFSQRETQNSYFSENQRRRPFKESNDFYKLKKKKKVPYKLNSLKEILHLNKLFLTQQRADYLSTFTICKETTSPRQSSLPDLILSLTAVHTGGGESLFPSGCCHKTASWTNALRGKS